MTFEIGTTVSTEGIDALIARMERLPAIVAKFAELILIEAQHLVPVKSGALKASIVAHLDGLAAEITAGEGLDYAAYVEYGTARAPAQAFLRPAVERYADDFLREIQEVFG